MLLCYGTSPIHLLFKSAIGCESYTMLDFFFLFFLKDYVWDNMARSISGEFGLRSTPCKQDSWIQDTHGQHSIVSCFWQRQRSIVLFLFFIFWFSTQWLDWLSFLDLLSTIPQLHLVTHCHSFFLLLGR
jgi:hypothetical protein